MPTSLALIPIPGGLRAAWLASGAESSWLVRTSDDGGSTWGSPVSASSLTTDLTGLDWATEYSVQVSGDGGGSWTDAVAETPLINPAGGDAGIVWQQTGVVGLEDYGDVAALESDDWSLALDFERLAAGIQEGLIGIQFQVASADGLCGLAVQVNSSNQLVPRATTGSSVNTAVTVTSPTFGAAAHHRCLVVKSGTALTVYGSNGTSIGSGTTSSATMDWATTVSKKTAIGGFWNSDLDTFAPTKNSTVHEALYATKAWSSDERTAVLAYLAGQHDAPASTLTDRFVDTGLRASGTVSPTVAAGPNRSGNPVFTGTSVEDYDDIQAFGSVRKVGDSDYRLWFAARGGTASGIAYATSPDGLSWTNPNLGLVTYNSNTNNGLIINNAGSDTFNSTWVVGDGTFVHAVEKLNNNIAMRLYTSPDGTTWTLAKTLNDDFTPPSGSEIKEIVRRSDGRWLAYYVAGHASDRRAVRLAVSRTADLTGEWVDLGAIAAWASTAATEQWYTLSVFPVSSANWYAVAYRYDSTTELIDGDLFVSHDEGLTWTESLADWLPRGASEAWDEGLVWPGSWIERGGDWWYYYLGRDSIHNTPPTATGFGIVEVSDRRLGSITGTGNWVEQTIRAGSAPRALLNGDPGSGTITAAVLDPISGDPLPGYDDTDCDPIAAATGDGAEITWGGKSLPPGRDMRVRLTLTSATAHSLGLQATGGNGGLLSSTPVVTQSTPSAFRGGSALAIDYVPASAILAGDVISLGADGLIGIAIASAESGQRTALIIAGEASFLKATSTTFDAGDSVYWDASAELATSDNSGGKPRIGAAIVPAVSGSPVVSVLMAPELISVD